MIIQNENPSHRFRRDCRSYSIHMPTLILLFLPFLFHLFSPILPFPSPTCFAYNTSAGLVPGKLNVHLVPHSHDDVGWLKTVDQYYVGSNHSIQGACVQNVLDSLIPALLADKNRKFIYVEQAFFQRWWRRQTPSIQTTVRHLVQSGQLEFINGGMCMHDEATAHYIDMIDQTTLGHRYLKQQFNVTPRIGWQIDPFGHSAVQAYLLGAELGFDSLFFARIDYQDRAKRKVDKTLELVWQASKTFGSSAQIFTGAFPENYEPPSSNFYFEVDSESPLVQDDIDLFDYNVPDRINDFVSAAIAQANITRTNHIMWTMGTDFNYQYAHTWFRQMDKFIHYVNQDGRVNALYSTPSIYTDAKYAADEYWPVKTDDYFPYADRVNAYWTGYFTSRPALKGYVRMMSSYYLAARQLEFFKGKSKSGPKTDSLADALALAQHHDAITGTEKQHVANDYAKRLSIGYKEAEKLVATSLACLSQLSSTGECQIPAAKIQQCPLLNISYCPASEVDLSDGKDLVVIVYNSLGWKREDVIRIPVFNEDIFVQDSTGKKVESQLLPVIDASLSFRDFHTTAYVGVSPKTIPTHWLAFSAIVPPLGFSTYIISSDKGAAAKSGRQTIYKSHQNATVEVGPGNLKLIYTAHDGKLARYINTRTSVEEVLEQSYGFYSGNDGSVDYQASGAYVFRPNLTYPIRPEWPVLTTVLRGPLLDEVHQKINSWIYQVTRVYKGREHAEVEFIIGPIPVDDRIGKEVTTEITTTIQNDKRFYTDSNGRDFIERIRDYRKDWKLQVNQPVAGNYYPINLGIFMNDNTRELSVLVDRSVGGSSIRDGQLELMLHRRLLHDDSRGVDEALNEIVCVQDECIGLTIAGKYYLRIDPLGEGAKWRRSFGQEIYSPMLLAFTLQDKNDWTMSHLKTFSGIDPSYHLPENVAIITLQELENGKVLLRLAHLYEIGEDKDLSVMATVELRKLFPEKKTIKVTETSLSANQERAEMEKKRLVWKVEGNSKGEKALRGGPVNSAKLVVELAPMEIRTFLIDFTVK
ncbi:putative alpha-mannosidase [Cucurbita argyrosperma subsp. argyrosperma]|nr:putative alpha-mannosidase [Cucurbita argyrosperma subsp. argyrosperma]